MAKMRYRMKPRRSKRMFRKTAKKVHTRNYARPMRGGYRL